MPISEEIKKTITHFFEPVTNSEDANCRFSTTEIAEKIAEHTGEETDIKEVFLALQSLGFIANPDADMNFFWLMRTSFNVQLP